MHNWSKTFFISKIGRSSIFQKKPDQVCVVRTYGKNERSDEWAITSGEVVHSLKGYLFPKQEWVWWRQIKQDIKRSIKTYQHLQPISERRWSQKDKWLREYTPQFTEHKKKHSQNGWYVTRCDACLGTIAKRQNGQQMHCNFILNENKHMRISKVLKECR